MKHRTLPSDAGLADRLRAATHDLHGRAEASGIVRDLLAGRATRAGYALYLRNLLPAYAALEAGLDRHAGSPRIAPIARPVIYRAAAIRADLGAIGGDDWPQALPVVPAGQRYADRVAALAEVAPQGLVAHAYVRYLGDLSGGLVLRRLLTRSLALDESALGFYTFAAVDDTRAFRDEFRGAFDAVGADLDAQASDELVAEARRAFEHNIDVSLAVADATD